MKLLLPFPLQGALIFPANKPSVYNMHLNLFASWGQQLADEADCALVGHRFQSWGLQFKAAMIGTVKFSEGSWFLARPSMLPEAERGHMWFGHIRAVFMHKGPIGANTLFFEVRVRSWPLPNSSRPAGGVFRVRALFP